MKLGLVGKFAKRPGICIVVEVAEVRAARGLLLRQWSQEKGLSKSGVWLPLVHWENIRKLFERTLASIDEVPEVDF